MRLPPSQSTNIRSLAAPACASTFFDLLRSEFSQPAEEVVLGRPQAGVFDQRREIFTMLPHPHDRTSVGVTSQHLWLRIQPLDAAKLPGNRPAVTALIVSGSKVAKQRRLRVKILDRMPVVHGLRPFGASIDLPPRAVGSRPRTSPKDRNLALMGHQGLFQNKPLYRRYRDRIPPRQPLRPGREPPLHLNDECFRPLHSVEARESATPTDALPRGVCANPGPTVQDVADRESTANSLKNPQRVKEVRFTAGIGADEEVHRPQVQLHITEALEVPYRDSRDHEVRDVPRSTRRASCSATTAAHEPDSRLPWRVSHTAASD